MKDLAEKVVVITGAASGVGRGMAEAFADAGAHLLLVDIHQGRLDELAERLADKVKVVTQRVDVRDARQIEVLAERAYQSFGAVHVLCNNAGVACHGLLWEHSQQDWDWILETNVHSIANSLRTFVPRMLAQGQPAHIVNTASMLGLSSSPLTGIYGASKQAVVGMTESLRMDLMLVGADIEVSVLCPGPVRTNVSEEPGRGSAAVAELPELAAEVDAALKAVIADGMAPLDVGRCVVDAVREGRFWILPAPEFIANADQRLADIHAVIDDRNQAKVMA